MADVVSYSQNWLVECSAGWFSRRTDNGQCVMATLIDSLLKIALDLRHLVGDMGETHDVFRFHLRKSVEGSRFHLYTKNPFRASILNRCNRLPEWCIRRPGCAAQDVNSGRVKYAL